MVRVYHEHPGREPTRPRTFGPVARFDPQMRDRRQHPRTDPQGRGALYLAEDLGTALAEAYSGLWPEVPICPHARAVWLLPPRAIDLLDLTGPGAMAIGAVGTLQWGDEPRHRTQRWARKLYEQYAELDGTCYQAAHQGGIAVVLWDRAPTLEGPAGGDRKLWAVWSRVTVALAGQGRTARRTDPSDCAGCQHAGFTG
jgi:hypothetical protein